LRRPPLLPPFPTRRSSDLAGSSTFGASGAGSIVFRFQGSGLSAPADVTLTTLAGTTVAEAISDLSSQVANNTTLKAAGISLTTTDRKSTRLNSSHGSISYA